MREEVGQEAVPARATWNNNCVRVMGPEIMRSTFRKKTLRDESGLILKLEARGEMYACVMCLR